jgi:hypothetical protein
VQSPYGGWRRGGPPPTLPPPTPTLGGPTVVPPTPPGSEIARARQRLEERQQRDVQDHLDGLQRHRAAAEQDRARKEQAATVRLQGLLPASTVLAEAFRALERRARAVGDQPLHEVAVQLRDPAPDCIRVSLRWGTKFGLTDTDKDLMHSYRTARRRWRRYPDVVMAHDYHEVWGVLDGSSGTLRLSSGQVVPVETFVDDPDVLAPHLGQALAAAERRTRYHLRASAYEASPTPG